MGFFLAGSGCVAALFGEAVVSTVAVGITVAPAICQTGSFSDHIDSCGRGGAGIAVSVSIAPADRLELKGAEHGPLPARSWGVAAFLRETVFGITAVGIAGTLGLLAGSKIFHARVGFSSCAGIGVGLPIASTDWIKNFVTPTTGARVHAGFKDGVDLRGVALAGGDCDRCTLLQAFGIGGPINLESCTCEASEARFIFRVGGHPGLEAVHWIRVNWFGLREGNGLGIRKVEVVRKLEYSADCRIVVPHLKGVDHVALSAAADHSRGDVPLFGIQPTPVFQRVPAGISIWVSLWVCKQHFAGHFEVSKDPAKVACCYLWVVLVPLFTPQLRRREKAGGRPENARAAGREFRFPLSSRPQYLGIRLQVCDRESGLRSWWRSANSSEGLLIGRQEIEITGEKIGVGRQILGSADVDFFPGNQLGKVGGASDLAIGLENP